MLPNNHQWLRARGYSRALLQAKPAERYKQPAVVTPSLTAWTPDDCGLFDYFGKKAFTDNASANAAIPARSDGILGVDPAPQQSTWPRYRKKARYAVVRPKTTAATVVTRVGCVSFGPRAVEHAGTAAYRPRSLSLGTLQENDPDDKRSKHKVNG